MHYQSIQLLGVFSFFETNSGTWFFLNPGSLKEILFLHSNHQAIEIDQMMGFFNDPPLCKILTDKSRASPQESAIAKKPSKDNTHINQ